MKQQHVNTKGDNNNNTRGAEGNADVTIKNSKETRRRIGDCDKRSPRKTKGFVVYII